MNMGGQGDTMKSAAWRYGTALVSTAVALGIRVALTPVVELKFPFATFFFAVLFSAWFGGYGPALVAILAGAIASDLFFLPPTGSLWISSGDDQIGMVLFLFTCTGIAMLGGRMRASQMRVQEAVVTAVLQREYLQTALHSIGDAVIVTDAEGRINLLNPVAEKLTGWSSGDAYARPLEHVFVIQNEVTNESVANPVSKVLESGAVVGLANHTVLIAKDGTVRPIDDSAAPIFDADRRILGVILVFRDVTERRRAETAIIGSDARKTAILEAALDCIITMDHEGKIVEFNPAAERTFGYSRLHALGKQVGELIVPPHLREQHYQGLRRYMETGEGPVLEKRVEIDAMRADGTQFPVELAITRIVQNGPPMFTAYLRDIGRQKAEERRRNARLSIAQMLANTTAASEAAPAILKVICKSLDWQMGALWIVDRSNNTLRNADVWMEPALDGTEFSATTRTRSFEPGIGLPGRIWTSRSPAWVVDVTKDDNFPRAASAVQAGLHGAFGFPLLADGEVVGVIEFFSHEIRKPDDDLLEMMASVGSQIGQVLERRRTNEAFQRELEETDRRKDDFLAILAHELRNPLAPIRNALELMSLSPTAETSEWAKTLMKRQIEHIVRLVDDLMDISRIMRGKIQLRTEPVELSSAIHDAIEEAKPAIDLQEQEITVTLPRESIWVEGDPTRLLQIISNLLNNAAKYTDMHGRIALSLELVEGKAKIKVRDSGIGLSPDMLQQIFIPFTQVTDSLNRSRGGLGIGLALVRSLVEMHGGTVTAHSDGEGKGTEFVVMLPTMRPRHVPHVKDWKPTPVAARRVLVVDDNHGAAESLAVLLAKVWGHEVKFAHDGTIALEMVEQYHPEIVFLDIGLPGLSGYDVAKSIRRMPQGDSILLVALTGFGQDEDRRKSSEAGFDDHLVKPAAMTALQATFESPKLTKA